MTCIICASHVNFDEALLAVITEGYFESGWCPVETATAIAHKKEFLPAFHPSITRGEAGGFDSIKLRGGKYRGQRMGKVVTQVSGVTNAQTTDDYARMYTACCCDRVINVLTMLLQWA